MKQSPSSVKSGANKSSQCASYFHLHEDIVRFKVGAISTNTSKIEAFANSSLRKANFSPSLQMWVNAFNRAALCNILKMK